jgi:hypothetical protein
MKTAVDLIKESPVADHKRASRASHRGAEPHRTLKRLQDVGTPVAGTVAAKRAANHERSAPSSGAGHQGNGGRESFPGCDATFGVRRAGGASVEGRRRFFGEREGRIAHDDELANRGSQRQNPARGSASSCEPSLT